ncbi:bifunctional folylpolyglutamate synthase/dihydrofolate synthase [Thiotrichales bacterium 19S3-7]|nr:bifunctional folylpolyglutamate synthase/dihydrofolate synthase [Thiotrichales bacterium 19S3-7]MCF6801317.1 bifunctional folylpolyglutamate synthase/dihydrofolate synthase [Thiotrichales bacterium 19S3-11]
MLTLQKHSNLSNWLNRLEAIGFVERLDIVQVKRIVSQLGVSKDFFLITVTGTNGKGSTCHLLDSVLRKSGYKVGLFTSPHLFKYNERISINGHLASDEQIVLALEQVDLIANKLDLTLGYFSYTFLAACVIFSQAELDFLILEVGCGGRLDPSNAFDADIVAITSIGLDHQDLLGDTREKIALEKAALARANKPVVIGEAEFPKTALTYLNKLNANCFSYDALTLETQYAQSSPKFLHVNNLKVVIKILMLLKSQGFNINEEMILSSLASFSLLGRTQVLTVKQKTVIFDVGHNEQCFSYLVKYLKKNYPKNKVKVLYTAFANKSVGNVITACGNYFDQWIVTSLKSLDNRAMPLDDLVSYFAYQSYTSFEQPEVAFESMLNNENDQSIYVVSGSFVLVSYLLSYCNKKGYI